jgi:hypothetical protein
MQFTVLIEFLVPGLATTLLLLYIYLGGTMPTLPPGLPVGETASALLLLAVSYPVGILVNFPLFKLQRRIISRKVRQELFKNYESRDIDLVALVSTQFGFALAKPPVTDHEKLESAYRLLRAFVFSKNIERLYANHNYHESLQRLARGILPPLVLAAGVVVWKMQIQPRSIALAASCLLLAVSACYLLHHSIEVEYEQVVSYFLVLRNSEQRANMGAVE